MFGRVWTVVVALAFAVGAAVSPGFLVASDHDDGEIDMKGRSLNLTDLYVFREGDQSGNAAQNSNLIFVMNTNPRSIAQQQYYFSTRARYEFKVERVTNVNASPTAAGLAQPDVVLRFEFGEPSATTQQRIRVTAIRDGQTMVADGGLTTPLNAAPVINTVSVGGSMLHVFAGLREDPFFFDVEQFFRVRAFLASGGAIPLPPGSTPWRTPGFDFADGYNVNAIVVSVPIIGFLQGSTTVTAFDVWETISVPGQGASAPNQVERLAQPAVNEGLIRSNDLLNLLNSVSPECEADALAGKQPCATTLGPVLTEAIGTLAALGNSTGRINAIAASFIPDVMRIDTTAPSGYGLAINTIGASLGFPDVGRPIRGRKLTDDVIDGTLSMLIPGSPPGFESDNVSYAGPNAGGTTRMLPFTTFPYLRPPN